MKLGEGWELFNPLTPKQMRNCHICEGREKHPNKKRIGVNRAVLGRFGYFRPPKSCPGCRREKTRIGQIEKKVRWEPSFGPNSLFCANRSCRNATLVSSRRNRLFTFSVGRFFWCSYVRCSGLFRPVLVCYGGVLWCSGAFWVVL